MRYVVLLRAINLGSHNKVSMKELRPALEEAGFGDVRTVHQSGNVVVDHDGPAEAVEREVHAVLSDRFGLDVDMLVRDAAQWRAVVADDPFPGDDKDPKQQFVIFCSQEPETLPVAEPPELLVARGAELHAWCPNGVANGKLITAVSRKPPAPVSTFRNWGTVLRIAELL